jgi:hypothetical protein
VSATKTSARSTPHDEAALLLPSVRGLV